jgi:putrescine transport system permease protein
MSASRESRSLRNWFDARGWRNIVIAMPYVWLVFFFLLPAVIVLAMSFAWQAIASPPMTYGHVWPYLNGANF